MMNLKKKIIGAFKHSSHSSKFLELFNAFSMFLPVVSMSIKVYNYKKNIQILLILLATWCHLPFSFIYHIRSALLYDAHRLNNFWRKADQCFIHISCFLYSVSLSNLSTLFTIFSFFYNGWAILYICDVQYNSQNEERVRLKTRLSILGSVLLYLLPITFTHTFLHFLELVSFFIFASIFFLFSPHLFGYGHGLFHLFLVPYANNLIDKVI